MGGINKRNTESEREREQENKSKSARERETSNQPARAEMLSAMFV